MPLFSRNVDLGSPLKATPWRKIAIGTWMRSGDPSVYAIAEFDATKMLEYIQKLQSQTSERITITHFMGRAVGACFAKHPSLNCILRFGRLYPRNGVDVFFQVASDGDGNDLSGCVIRSTDKKSVVEIAAEMKGRVKKIREHGDPEYKKSKDTMKLIPGMFVGYLLNVLGFLMYSLNIWTPLIGSPRDPFGTVMITNIGSIGLDLALAPLVPYSRVPILLALAAVKDTPVVRDGKVVVAPILKIGVTIDHRIIDGMHASKMFKTMQEIFQDPEAHLGVPERTKDQLVKAEN